MSRSICLTFLLTLCTAFSWRTYPYGTYQSIFASHDAQVTWTSTTPINTPYLAGTLLGILARLGQTCLTMHPQTPRVIHPAEALYFTRNSLERTIEAASKVGIGALCTCTTHFLAKHFGNVIIRMIPALKHPEAAHELKKGFLHGHTTSSIAILVDGIGTHYSINMHNDYRHINQEIGALLASIYCAHDIS